MKGRRGLIFFAAAVLLIAAAVLAVLADIRIRAVRGELSEFTAKNAAASAILCGVEETVKDAKFYYSDVTKIVRDGEGNVKSIITDAARLNTVSNAANRNVDKRISSLSVDPVKIPLTSLFGSELVGGIGPKITFYVTMIGTASTNFENVFDSAGVNQTRHQIMLNVSADIYVVFGGSVKSYTVETDVCIAENIIVGITPQAVAQITDD